MPHALVSGTGADGCSDSDGLPLFHSGSVVSREGGIVTVMDAEGPALQAAQRKLEQDGAARMEANN